MMRLSRRRLLGAAAAGISLPAVRALSNGESAAAHGGEESAAAGNGASRIVSHEGAAAAPAAGGDGHGDYRPGFDSDRIVDHAANGFNPTELLRDFDYGRTRRLASGRVLREWELVAIDKEIEVAPGVKFPAWTYNGRVPGPTLRCREGERLRIHFTNNSEHPHTIHFHGIHTALMDGLPGIGEHNGGGLIEPGQSFTYEFDAAPFGIHHYHCHANPLATHIARGLYGAFIVDPKDGRPDADEMVMVMNGFDTNFDMENEIYSVNTVAFHYKNEPIQVERNELTRIYLVNMLEFDPINSFHIHGNFFRHYPTGTFLEPRDFTDTIIQGQAERAILEVSFPFNGEYMVHAHKTEFATLGWMGFFQVGDPSSADPATAYASYRHPHGRADGDAS